MRTTDFIFTKNHLAFYEEYHIRPDKDSKNLIIIQSAYYPSFHYSLLI